MPRRPGSAREGAQGSRERTQCLAVVLEVLENAFAQLGQQLLPCRDSEMRDLERIEASAISLMAVSRRIPVPLAVRNIRNPPLSFGSVPALDELKRLQAIQCLCHCARGDQERFEQIGRAAGEYSPPARLSARSTRSSEALIPKVRFHFWSPARSTMRPIWNRGRLAEDSPVDRGRAAPEPSSLRYLRHSHPCRPPSCVATGLLP